MGRLTDLLQNFQLKGPSLAFAGGYYVGSRQNQKKYDPLTRRYAADCDCDCDCQGTDCSECGGGDCSDCNCTSDDD